MLISDALAIDGLNYRRLLAGENAEIPPSLQGTLEHCTVDTVHN